MKKDLITLGLYVLLIGGLIAFSSIHNPHRDAINNQTEVLKEQNELMKQQNLILEEIARSKR